MADLKISQLTSATTPLAGTEVLPIVQSSTTRQVSIANVTAGRTVAMNNATVGSGGTANVATRIFLNGTNNAANGAYIQGQRNSSPAWLIGDYQTAFGSGSGYVTFTYGAVPTVFYNTVAGEQLRLDGTDVTLSAGNLIQGTAGKGINFTANTNAPGMTSELLNWYEEGTWTPNDGSGAGLTFTNPEGYYTRVGRVVTVFFYVMYPTTVNANAARIGGLPFTSANIGNGRNSGIFNINTSGQTVQPSIVAADTKFAALKTALGTSATNAELSGAQLQGGFTYFV